MASRVMRERTRAGRLKTMALTLRWRPLTTVLVQAPAPSAATVGSREDAVTPAERVRRLEELSYADATVET